MTKYILFVIASCFALSLSPAFASEQKEIGKFGVWTAYVFEENGGKVCYMAANPNKDEGKYKKRGEILAMITHRPGEGTRNVFS